MGGPRKGWEHVFSFLNAPRQVLHHLGGLFLEGLRVCLRRELKERVNGSFNVARKNFSPQGICLSVLETNGNKWRLNLSREFFKQLSAVRDSFVVILLGFFCVGGLDLVVDLLDFCVGQFTRIVFDEGKRGLAL
jgi:hypothetical protein